MAQSIRIGIIGDFDAERPSHRATNAALFDAAAFLGIEIDIQWLPMESLEKEANCELAQYDGLWCAPGSPYRSMQGALNAIRFAREKDIPFIGTCGGFQHAVIEYARDVLGIDDALHGEYSPDASKLFISALACSLVGETKKILITVGSKAYRIYSQPEVEERYNCSFGLNPEYQKLLHEGGFKVAGTDENGDARILELPQNRFYLATLFQPQLSSTPEHPHRLVVAYLNSVLEFQQTR